MRSTDRRWVCPGAFQNLRTRWWAANRCSGRRVFTEPGLPEREAERLVGHPRVPIEPVLQEPCFHAWFFAPGRPAGSELEVHVQERPPGGVARHLRVQVAHVREARVDDLVRWRLPVAVVVVGDLQLEIQGPREFPTMREGACYCAR